jgi:hypothetical protein
MVGQSQLGTESDHIYYSSMEGVGLCCAFYKQQQTGQNCRAKTIVLSQTNMF